MKHMLNGLAKISMLTNKQLEKQDKRLLKWGVTDVFGKPNAIWGNTGNGHDQSTHDAPILTAPQQI